MTGRKIELLAPARDLQGALAAVDFGADALYVGAPRFGARATAGNTVDDIARMVAYARRFGVRTYAALNTLVYEEELAGAEAQAREVIAAGVDALIVQDMAYMRMGLEGAEMHASTQTHNVTPRGVRFLQECGFSRVILERGLTLERIAEIRAATGVSLEAFVHGAVCVGYSGRCQLSRTMSPRSGNRGVCAQPCRLPYDLVDVRGAVVERGKHLLSLRDLDLSSRLGDLLSAGIDSFKIEGRLKDVSYVKNTVAFYRRALDGAMGGGMERASQGESRYDFEPDPGRTFSRSAGTYYLDGKRRGAAKFSTPKATGTPLGRVTGVDGEGFTIDARDTLSPGDGICFLSPSGALTGTGVNAVRGGRVIPDKMDGIAVGTLVMRNRDHAFLAALSHSRTRRVIDVRAEVEFPDLGMRLTLSDRDGNSTAAWEAGPLPAAQDPPRMERALREQIGKSGETPFRVTQVTVGGQVRFAPVSTINSLRRQAMAQLLALREATPPPREPRAENLAARHPSGHLDGHGNVTNSLAERFYRDHGVEVFDPAHELSGELSGVEVMRTPYCVRRETGRCERGVNAPLWLARDGRRYRLEFDCENCEMSVVYER